VNWTPIIPADSKSQAELLAPLCRLLRDDVTDALVDPASALQTTARDWRQLLFPDASDARFADSYAHTVTFALLLARSEGASLDTVAGAVAQLQERPGSTSSPCAPSSGGGGLFEEEGSEGEEEAG
jgi:hypothetical protein